MLLSKQLNFIVYEIIATSKTKPYDMKKTYSMMQPFSYFHKTYLRFEFLRYENPTRDAISASNFFDKTQRLQFNVVSSFKRKLINKY